jgi:hypothetical protein
MSQALIAVVLAETACGVSTVSVTANTPIIGSIDTGLTQACKGATNLPDKALTQGQVERLRGKDRANLRTCKDRHAGLARAVRERDRLIEGG